MAIFQRAWQPQKLSAIHVHPIILIVINPSKFGRKQSTIHKVPFLSTRASTKLGFNCIKIQFAFEINLAYNLAD